MPGSYTAPQPPTVPHSLPLSSNSNPYRCLAAPSSPPCGSAAQISDTAILDSSTSDIYFAPNVPVTNVNPSAPTSTVTNAAGACHHSSAQADYLLSTLPVCSGKIMPLFIHTLLGVDCSVTMAAASSLMQIPSSSSIRPTTPSSSKGCMNPHALNCGTS
eukprot:CCRYP_017604-RA/>CCRYP_017604-RA protein AED:0.84 eAED:1.00 QI:0/-1/0/1/-1/1/1/0/158